MKTFGWKLFIFMIVLSLSLVLVGCDDEETPDTPDTPSTDTGDGEVQDTPAPHTHAFGAWQTVKEANCGKVGELSRSCDCGEVETQPIAPSGEHQFTVQNVCEVCGDRLSYTDGLIYSATDDGTGYVVTGVEKSVSAEQIIVPPYYESLPVVGVGEGAFASLLHVVKIVLPDSILTIGASAFSGCSALVEVNVPSGVTVIEEETFLGCAALVELVLPEGLLHVGARAFEGCVLLVSIVLPEGVETIGASAFSGCGALVSVSIPEKITQISDRCFYGCISLTAVTLPASVARIGDGAFGGCTLLVEITLTDLSFVGEGAFADCDALTLIPHVHKYDRWYEAVAPQCELGGEDRRDCGTEGCPAFEVKTSRPAGHAYQNGQCKNCTSRLEDSTGLAFKLSADGTYYILSGIGECTSRDLVIPASYEGLPVKEIAAGAFSLLAGGRVPDPSKSLLSLSIPDSVESIGNNAFHSNTLLSTVYFGNGLKEIGEYAFFSCGILKLTLPDSVQTLGKSAFAGTAVHEVDLGDGVKSLPDNLFENCTGLYRVRFGASVNDVSAYAFSGCKKLIELCWAPTARGHVQENYKYSYKEDKYGSLIFVDEEGYVFFETYGYYENDEGESVKNYYLIAYVGEDTELKLPADCNGQPYEVYTHFISRNPNMDGIVSVVISDGVTMIGENAFANMHGLRSVRVGKNVKNIHMAAFESCYNLMDLTLEEGIQGIGIHAFARCYGLISLTIPASVQTIAGGAFLSCYKLVEIYNLSTAESLADLSYELGQGAQVYAIHTSADAESILFTDEEGFIFAVKSDGSYVLMGANLTEPTDLYLPSSVRDAGYTIHSYVFAYNDCVTGVLIPDGITEIPAYAFFSCDNLKSVVIGAGVSKIDTQALDSCKKLQSLSFYDTTTWTAKGGKTFQPSELSNSRDAAEVFKKYSNKIWTKA